MDNPNDISIVIPSMVENLQLPDPNLLTYYRNLENRTLWLDTDVDDSLFEFVRHIIRWNEEDKGVPVEDRRPVRLMIFSYGGDLDVNNAFIDVVRTSQTPIWAINLGQACSAACFISIACHKRFALPNATYLIHQGGGDGISGTYQQVMSAMLEYQRKIEEIEAFLIANTKIPQDILEEQITTEWFISAKEAVEYGICDKIIESLDEIL